MSNLAVITGGTRGIGAAISKAFDKKGYRVVATYGDNEEKAQAFHQETKIPVVKWDVSQWEACVQGVQKIEKDFAPVDILVNNAGITRDTLLSRMTVEQWHEVMHTNLDSIFYMCRNVIEGMRKRQFGRIINMSSVNALGGQRGQTNYAASKAGILGFTKSLAREVAHEGITVNAVAPGYIETDMVQAISPSVLEKIVEGIPVKRLGTAAEVADLVLFLATAPYITGATLSINGGQLIA